MANLKINGDTSGSVTLAAPATGSAVTLTLPAATGTVALSNGTTYTGTHNFTGATVSGAAAEPGLSLVTPTSVAGTGVTVSGAVVSFTTATAVSVNGCFTATYDNYLVVGAFTAASANVGVRGRMRAAGTDNSAANYYGSLDIMAAASGVITQSDGGAGATYFGGIGLASGSEGANFQYNFYAPALTQRTGVLMNCMRSAGLYFGSSALSVTTSYDGFTIYPAADNISGTLRVYGLRNS